MNKRTLGVLIVTVVLLSLVAGCGPSAGGAATPVPTEVPKTPLVIGTTDKATDIDPANSYDFHTWEIHHNTMDTLLVYKVGTTELEPGLAKEWPTVSADGKEYTFKLREGLKFPDGTPFNADAVVWSINRVVKLQGDPNWLVTSFVDKVEKVDDYTVKFTLTDAVGFFPYLVATQPYSPVSPNCYPADEFAPDSTCGGIGHYKIVSWKRDVELQLEANPDYYGTPPAWPKITIRYFADSTAMRLALESGEIDVAWKTLTPTDYKDFRANSNFKVFEGVGPYIRYICFNNQTAPFDNALVRQGLAYAIDRDAISNVAYQGTHQALYSMVPAGMVSHIDAFPKRDLDKAKQLLGQAGFTADTPLTMDLWWTPTHYGPTEGDVATLIKQQIEETGLAKVNLQSTEWATYKDYMSSGSMPVFLLGWYPDYLDPDDYTSPFAECNASDDMGIFYCNSHMDDLLKQARLGTDMQARAQLYEQIQQLWTTEVPTLPFTQGKLLVVTKPNVSGVTLDPTLFLHYFTLSK
jgi:peptide/nickel transport system substrate-binding protein